MTCEKDPSGCRQSPHGEEKAEAVELMDDFWFYQSMFDKTRMFRSSVAAACSNTSTQVQIKHPCDRFSSINPKEVITSSSSPPPEREKTTQVKETHVQFSSLTDVPSQSNQQDSNKPNVDENEKRSAYDQNRSWKRLSDLEFEEIQGFMDLGFRFNKEEMDPSVVSMIPGLQDKRWAKDEKMMRRPYLSEAWFVQRYEAPKFNWVERKSGVDMKQQLRVWARAVAYNVRQEC